MIPAQRYNLEFVLHTYNSTLQMVRNSLAEFGESLEIAEYKEAADSHDSYSVKIKTDEPTLIFDLCAQFGRIRSVKVTEEERGSA